MPIRSLPRQLVDQIAAGEVVERPASAVKELLENALDAGATRIVVEIEGGGADRIAITDNGMGIPSAELPLAVASHATSKIASLQDLACVTTLGFRGEALASIGSVSRLSITSRTAQQGEAWRLTVDGGTAADPAPAPGPVGTLVEVKQLFHNVPARRRFLRSASTESGRIQEVVEAVAVSRPGTAFTLIADGRERLALPATEDPKRRVIAVLGESVAEVLLEISSETPTEGGGTLTIWGLIGKPEIARATGRAVRLALNGRAVQDRTLLHAVKEAYRGLIDPGRSPVAFIAIEMDPTLVDVNVHPAKTEVRFRQSGVVHTAVLRAVRDALRAANLVPAFALGGHAHIGVLPVGAPDSLAPAVQSPAPRSSILDAFTATPAHIPPSAPRAAVMVDDHPALVDNRRAWRVLQVHGTYLVVEDEQGILIIDQHALHERAMFEELRQRVSAGTLESQRFLVPVTPGAEPRAVEALDIVQPLLARLGIDASAAGPRALAIHAFPTFLLSRRVDPGVFMLELLERVADDGLPTDSEAALHEVLDMMSCKAAIKAGDHLSGAELAALLEQRERIERQSSCPHGRPTSLRISIQDLERQFGRA